MSSREHQQAQELAAQAGRFGRCGELGRGHPLYAKAADLEKYALDQLPADRSRTRGILSVSLASLLFKARRFDEAETVIQKSLSPPDALPGRPRRVAGHLQAIQEGRAGNGQATVIRRRWGGSRVRLVPHDGA